MSINFKTMLWHSACFFVNVYASLCTENFNLTHTPVSENVPISTLSVLIFLIQHFFKSAVIMFVMQNKRALKH